MIIAPCSSHHILPSRLDSQWAWPRKAGSKCTYLHFTMTTTTRTILNFTKANWVNYRSNLEQKSVKQISPLWTKLSYNSLHPYNAAAKKIIQPLTLIHTNKNYRHIIWISVNYRLMLIENIYIRSRQKHYISTDSIYETTPGHTYHRHGSILLAVCRKIEILQNTGYSSTEPPANLVPLHIQFWQIV